MLENWKNRRNAARRRETDLAAVLGRCDSACFANATRDRLRAEVALVVGPRR